MTVFSFILVAFLGLLIGVVSGMFGIGGGTMMVPALSLIFRLPILNSTATSLFVIAPTALAGALRSLRSGVLDVRTAMIVGACGAAAAAASSYISGFLPPIVITIAVVLVILYSAFETLRASRRTKVQAGGANGADGAKTGVEASKAAESAEATEAAEAAEASKAATTDSKFGFVAKRVVLGLGAGAAAGIVGVGGGFIIVPICIAYFGFSFREATAVSLLSIAMIAIPGIAVHAALGHITYLYGLALMVGTIPGALIGVRLIAMIPERAARIAFAIFLALTAIALIVGDVMMGVRI